jgi:hypothetical protein
MSVVPCVTYFKGPHQFLRLKVPVLKHSTIRTDEGVEEKLPACLTSTVYGCVWPVDASVALRLEESPIVDLGIDGRKLLK